MSTLLVSFTLLGFFTYWVVKAKAVINSSSPIVNLKEFAQANMFEFIISVIGVVVLMFAGDEIPQDWGKFDTPLAAFIAGGSIPSIFNNFIGMFIRK